jgi:hypothetical protein
MYPSRDEHGKFSMSPCNSIPKEVLEVAVAQATNKDVGRGRHRGAAQGRVARGNARLAVPVGCTAHPLTLDHSKTAIDTPFFSPVVRMYSYTRQPFPSVPYASGHVRYNIIHNPCHPPPDNPIIRHAESTSTPTAFGSSMCRDRR